MDTFDPLHSLYEHPREHVGNIGLYARTEGVDDTKGLFFIVRFKPVVGAAAVTQLGPDPGATGDRCDRDSYGPYGFHEWNEEQGICYCGSTEHPDPATGAHLITFAGITFVNTVIDVFPVGIIIYLESTPEAEETQLATWPHTGGRTLQELFRQMVEWDEAYHYFDNREPVAVTCHEVLEQLAIPDEIRAWLLSEVPAQKVERFILGDPTARDRHAGVPAMSPEFDDWVCRLIETSATLGERRV